MGMGQRRIEPTDDEAARTAALWGPDPVHPTTAAYRRMAEVLEADLLNPESKYTNPGSTLRAAKKLRPDPCLERASWVAGCSAALPRRDSNLTIGSGGLYRGRSAAPRARGPPSRGSRHSSLTLWKKLSGGNQHGSRYKRGRGGSL